MTQMPMETPYKPSKIIVYEGDNDIALGASPNEFIENCRIFIHECRNSIPEAEIYFLSIKPRPARIRNWKDMRAANLLLEDLAKQNEKIHFIDIASSMTDDYGIPRPDIFVNDRLHLNKKRYALILDVLRSV